MGGSLEVCATRIIRHGQTAEHAHVVELLNNGSAGGGGVMGVGGTAGYGFEESGVRGTSGLAGLDGGASPQGHALFSILGDATPPVAFGMPLVSPSTNVLIPLGQASTLAFSTTNFTDDRTVQDSLRHVIQIVDSINPWGDALVQLTDPWVLNRAPHNHISFTLGVAMLGRTSCVRFVTSDLAGNVVTSVISSVLLCTEYRPPEPAMSCLPASGYTPLRVQFHDGSLNGPQFWLWDVNGDGTPDSTNRHPVFTYCDEGSYSVRLTVSNNYGTGMAGSASRSFTNAVRALYRTAYLAAGGAHAAPYTSWSSAATNLHALVQVLSNDTAILVSNGVYRLSQSLSLAPPLRALRGQRAGMSVLDGNGVWTLSVALSSTIEYITLSNFSANSRIAVAGALRNVHATKSGWVELLSGTLDSCLISGNLGCPSDTGDEKLSGAVKTYDACSIRNCTIWGNTFDGVFARKDTVHVWNSIAARTVGYPYWSISPCVGCGYVEAYSSCISNVSYHTSVYTDVIITARPGFVNASLGDYRLLASSPCIDAGNNSAVTTAEDMEGNPRIYDGSVDMGCYEFVPEPAGVLVMTLPVLCVFRRIRPIKPVFCHKR